MAKRRRKPHKVLSEAIDSRPQIKSDVAKELGMTIEQLRHIETGRRQPTLTQAFAIEDVLSVPARSWVG